MESLFESATNQIIIDRIKKINPSTKAEWGKMNVAQMLVHAQAPFKVANEELKLKRGLIGLLFGGMARKQLTGPKPFEKNLPTDKIFLVTGNPDFQLEKANLSYSLLQFINWTDSMKHIAEHGSGNVIFFDGSTEGLEKTIKQTQALGIVHKNGALAK